MGNKSKRGQTPGTLGEQLWRLREQSQSPRTAIARKTGLNPMTIRKVEEGSYRTTIYNVAKIARALGYYLEFKLRRALPVELDDGDEPQLASKNKGD